MVYCTSIFLLNVCLYFNLFNRGPRGRLAMPNELPSINKDFHFTSLHFTDITFFSYPQRANDVIMTSCACWVCTLSKICSWEVNVVTTIEHHPERNVLLLPMPMRFGDYEESNLVLFLFCRI